MEDAKPKIQRVKMRPSEMSETADQPTTSFNKYIYRISTKF